MQFSCVKILEDEKVHNLLTIGEFPLYVIPLDEDVISFELDMAHKVSLCYICYLILSVISLYGVEMHIVIGVQFRLTGVLGGWR